MKRLLFLGIIILPLLFSSCRGQNYGILSYQEKNIDAVCTLNSIYKIQISKENIGGRVCFLEPKELSTVSFSIENSTVTANASGTKIPLPTDGTRGILAIFNMFSLSEGDLRCAKESEGYSYMEFSNDYGVYALTLNKSSLPKSVRIVSSEYTFDIIIDTISLS